MNLKKIINPFGGKIYYKESTTSTMTEARDLLEYDADGSIFIAGFQTEGMGRVPGRKWTSSPALNLTFTLIINKDRVDGFGTTPLRVGLALSNAVRDLSGCDAKVKWPNDVLVDGQKISGILCHLVKESILIGVGINVNQREFDSDISSKSTSLSLLTDKGFSLELVISRFLESFYKVLEMDNWLKDLNTNLYRQGEIVSFSVGNPENRKIISGTLYGLDDQGRVVIEDDKGNREAFLSGEFL